jgi:hypothetical protein
MVKSLLKRPLTVEDCIYWSQNKTKNPITKYNLKENSKLLKEIEEECKSILEKKEVPKKTFESNSHYPDLEDPDFASKLSELYEYYIYKVEKYKNIKSQKEYCEKSNELCSSFEKTLYQYFVSNYISTRTPYKGILLYHGVGVGKTCSSITLAETFLVNHNIDDEPKIWVIMPQSLKYGFKEQVFNFDNYDNFEELKNQCTGDLYIKLANLMNNSDKDKAKNSIKKLINSRYQIFTYEKFVSFIETEYTSKQRVVKDKVIIIDEAHNIRTNENMEKGIYSKLVEVAETGINNRMVLLSATPMYNIADDILYLLYLLVLNDKRDILKLPLPSLDNASDTDMKTIKQLSSNYISYLRGKNPFAFALELSPKNFYKDVEYLDQEFNIDSNGNTIDKKYSNWLSNIKDSIVVSEMGEYQKKHIENKNNVNILNLQNTNIVYDYDLGEKGFNTFFRRTGNENGLTVQYNTKYMNALYPDKDHLMKYSGKINSISKIIKKTDGIIVIYSGYIWNGIIPMAVCLEHMGFQREEGRNILNKPKIIDNPPKYNLKRSPKYCILSSDNSDIMKGSSINSLVNKINSDDNIDGSQIKVILITPVASEGLSFYNIREIHIMEPWFHFNKIKQVIGRGIRNCRHQKLPLEKRNVSVFIHVSRYNSEKESPDMHALRISSHKFSLMNKIDNVIRNNAVDCFLMKNLNYFPKSLFELGKMKIKTSQNQEILIDFGDDEQMKPECKNITNIKYTGFRKETYKHFFPIIQNKLRKIFLESIRQDKWYIPMQHLIDNIQFDKNIIYQAIEQCLYPNNFIDGFIIVLYNNGLHITKVQTQTIKKIKLVKSVKKSVVKTNCSKRDLIKLTKKHTTNIVYHLYLSLNKDCFINLVKDIVEKKEYDETTMFIAEALYTNGVLIKNTDITSINNQSNYIGYVNIYNNDYEPIVYVNNGYRDVTEREMKQLMSNRKERKLMTNVVNENLPWGVISPEQKKNKFKIFTPGKGKGVKTGRECSTFEKDILESLLKLLNNDKRGNKNENCNFILNSLIEMGRININPLYIPK